MLRNPGWSDSSVQGTNDDAQVSKLSCTRAGYFRDDFIHLFVRKAARRSPLINRGYYSRHAALQQLLLDFLTRCKSRGLPCQVLCLGAGFDTTWFQLHADSPELLPARYLDVDFKEVTKRKASILSTQPLLRDRLAAAAAAAGAGGALVARGDAGGAAEPPASGLEAGQPRPAPAGEGAAAPGPAAGAAGPGLDEAVKLAAAVLDEGAGAGPTATAEAGAGEAAAAASGAGGGAASGAPYLPVGEAGGASLEVARAGGGVAPEGGTDGGPPEAEGLRGAGASPPLPAGTAGATSLPSGGAAAVFPPAGPSLPSGAAALTLPSRHLHSREGAAAAAAPSAPAAESGLCINVEAGEVLSSGYNLLPVNLKDLKALETALLKAGFQRHLPTYILSECVLVYMEPLDSAAIVGWLGSWFSTAALAVYEQVNPGDAFGRQMCSNLESRGCPLKGIAATPTLEAHCARMTGGGWREARSLDMDTIYKRHLDAADRARIERLEMFDEFEEWHMIQEHYCITLGINEAPETEGLLRGFGFSS